MKLENKSVERNSVWLTSNRNKERQLSEFMEWKGGDLKWKANFEIFDKDGSYCLKAHLPRVEKRDLKVYIDRDFVLLEGRRSINDDEKTEYCSFNKSFRFPSEIYEDRAVASFSGSLLNICLPHKETRHRDTVIIDAPFKVKKSNNEEYRSVR